MARAAQLDPEPVGALQRLAILELALGHLGVARSTLTRALGRWPTPAERAGIESVFCRTEVAQGAYAEARVHCGKALALLAETGRSGSLVGSYVNLAQVELRENHLETAEALAHRASEDIERQRRQAGNPQQMMEFLAARADALALLVELRLRLHAARPGAGWDAGRSKPMKPPAPGCSETCSPAIRTADRSNTKTCGGKPP